MWRTIAGVALAASMAVAEDPPRLSRVEIDFTADGGAANAALSPDGSLVAAGNSSGVLRTFETGSGKRTAMARLPGAVRSVRFVSSTLIEAMVGNELFLWNPHDKLGPRRVPDSAADSGPRGKAALPRFAATGATSRAVRILDRATGCVQHAYRLDFNYARDLVFSAGERHLMAVSANGIHIADTQSGVEVLRLPREIGTFEQAAFTPDHRIVVLAREPGFQVLRTETIERLRPLPAPQGRLYVVAVGVDDYRGVKVSLKFAQKDAGAVAEFFEKNANLLRERVESAKLLGDCATKVNLFGVLERLARSAHAEDALLVLLAGHGNDLGGQYYFYPSDLPSEEVCDVRNHGISATELAGKLERISARRQILILDACRSGAAVSSLFQTALSGLGAGRDLMVLTAAAASENAMEVDKLGHGILSWALLVEMCKPGRQAGTMGLILQSAADGAREKANEFDIRGVQAPEFRRFGQDFQLLKPSRGSQ